jgi:hypothetical protein
MQFIRNCEFSRMGDEGSCFKVLSSNSAGFSKENDNSWSPGCDLNSTRTEQGANVNPIR